MPYLNRAAASATLIRPRFLARMLNMRVRPCLRVRVSRLHGQFHLHCHWHATGTGTGTVTPSQCHRQTRSSYNLHWQRRGAAAAPPDIADLIPLSAKKVNIRTAKGPCQWVFSGCVRGALRLTGTGTGTFASERLGADFTIFRCLLLVVVVLKTESLTDANPSLHR